MHCWWKSEMVVMVAQLENSCALNTHLNVWNGEFCYVSFTTYNKSFLRTLHKIVLCVKREDAPFLEWVGTFLFMLVLHTLDSSIHATWPHQPEGVHSHLAHLCLFISLISYSDHYLPLTNHCKLQVCLQSLYPFLFYSVMEMVSYNMWSFQTGFF